MTFTNPYAGCIKTVRLQTMVDRQDYDFVRSIRPDTGTVTTTVNVLFAKLVDALKSKGIMDLTNKQQFEEFVANCKIL